MRRALIFFTFLLSICMNACTPVYAMTDTEAIQILDAMKTAFMNWDTIGGIAVGIAFLSGVMKLLKWERLGFLFAKIPKGRQSYVPLILGLAIGILEGLAAGATIPVITVYAIIGGVTGVIHHSGYQQLKGTPLGDFIAKMAGTLHTQNPSEKGKK